LNIGIELRDNKEHMEHKLMPVPYEDAEIDEYVTSCFPYEYIDELEDPARIIEKAKATAQKDLWTFI
jgi:hypothetical protein